MQIKQKILFLSTLTALLSTSYAFAYPNGSHQGQMDTDGILSPGEIENPYIDYRRAQIDHERHGDYRVDNRDNDYAARKDERRHRSYWRDDSYYRDRNDHDDDYYDHHRGWRDRDDRDNNSRSWWSW